MRNLLRGARLLHAWCTKNRLKLALVVLMLAGLGWLAHDRLRDPFERALTRTVRASLSGNPFTLTLVRTTSSVTVVLGLYRDDYAAEPLVRHLVENLLVASRGDRLELLELGDPPLRLPYTALAFGLLTLSVAALAWRRRWFRR